MPKCVNCSKAQSKLNPGDLCKSCIQLKSDDIYILKDEYSDNDDTLNSEIFPNVTSQERGVIDIIKEHMIIQQQQQQDYIDLLRNQIDYLKKDINFLRNDITPKKSIIENLICDNRNAIKELSTNIK